VKQDVTVTLSFIFSVISTIGLILNLFLTIRRDNKSQQKDDSAISTGIIKANMKLDQVCTTTLDINKQLDKLNDRVNEMALKQENHETRLRMLEEK